MPPDQVTGEPLIESDGERRNWDSPQDHMHTREWAIGWDRQRLD